MGSAVLFTALLLPLAVLSGLLTFRRFSPQLIDFWAPRWGYTVLWLLGVRLRIVGRERLVAPAIVVSNHQSTLDIPLMCALAPPGMVGFGKKEMAWVPLFGMAWWALGQVFIDRQDPAAARQTVADVAKMVRNTQRCVVLSPEGTRSRDGSLGPFKRGAFHLGVQTGLPIIPVVIQGAYACMPAGALLCRPGTVTMTVQAPISTEQWTEADTATHADALRAAYLGWLATPPPPSATDSLNTRPPARRPPAQ